MSDVPFETMPPENFSRMLYAPDAEVAVYLLLGLLWKHLPYDLAFEAFEINPNREGYAHTKFLDAKGKILEGGKWRDISIEFKLYSSGLIRDLEKHPALQSTCWFAGFMTKRP